MTPFSFYSAGDDYTWNPEYQPYERGLLENLF